MKDFLRRLLVATLARAIIEALKRLLRELTEQSALQQLIQRRP